MTKRKCKRLPREKTIIISYDFEDLKTALWENELLPIRHCPEAWEFLLSRIDKKLDCLNLNELIEEAIQETKEQDFLD